LQIEKKADILGINPCKCLSKHEALDYLEGLKSIISLQHHQKGQKRQL